MKITSKTLMVGFQTEVKLGNNDAIELTLIHQAYISRDQLGKLIVDMDLGIDIDNVKFLGIDIDADYTSFKHCLFNKTSNVTDLEYKSTRHQNSDL